MTSATLCLCGVLGFLGVVWGGGGGGVGLSQVKVCAHRSGSPKGNAHTAHDWGREMNVRILGSVIVVGIDLCDRNVSLLLSGGRAGPGGDREIHNLLLVLLHPAHFLDLGHFDTELLKGAQEATKTRLKTRQQCRVLQHVLLGLFDHHSCPPGVRRHGVGMGRSGEGRHEHPTWG